MARRPKCPKHRTPMQLIGTRSVNLDFGASEKLATVRMFICPMKGCDAKHERYTGPQMPPPCQEIWSPQL